MFGLFQLPSNSPSVAAWEALQGIQKKFGNGGKRKEDAAARVETQVPRPLPEPSGSFAVG
jgi:hypothetical protein